LFKLDKAKQSKAKITHYLGWFFSDIWEEEDKAFDPA